MKPELARARLSVLTAALLFGTGGAAIKGTTLAPIQVACLRSGVAAIVLVLLLPEARRGYARDLLAPVLSYAATLSVLLLLEPVTNPLLTWVLHGEAPSVLALSGGSVLVGVLLARAISPPASLP